MEERLVYLTTIDNPFDPSVDFWSWYSYDQQLGHKTCETLARWCDDSPNMSPEDTLADVERAIDEIVRLDPEDIFIKLVKKRKVA